MTVYECQDCGKQTTTPKVEGWKQLVTQSLGVKILIILCADCAPTNGDSHGQ